MELKEVTGYLKPEKMLFSGFATDFSQRTQAVCLTDQINQKELYVEKELLIAINY